MNEHGRYRDPKGPETEHEPGSRGRVLRNKLGIKSKRAMDQAEFEALVDVQDQYVAEHITPSTRFTANLLKKMHRDWLGSIYDWAGAYRTVTISKQGFMWPPATRVPDLMEEFDRTLLSELTPCVPANVSEVAMALAQVHGEFLMIHPFREGNGRLARLLADFMSFQAGFGFPAYGFHGHGSRVSRHRYLECVKRAYLKDYRPLALFFEEALLAGGPDSASNL